MVPRFLIPFRARQLSHFFTDILVIGGGLAGLRSALAAEGGQHVLVITKDELRESNSHYAQGGIAGVIDPEDRFEDHVADTLGAGGNLCDEAVVDMVVRDGPRRIEELMAWGTRFDELAGNLTLGREGGHSHHRIVHALGDATGKEIMRAVIEQTRQRSNIEIWEHTFTLDLLTEEGCCVGAMVKRQGQSPVMVWAKQTILATGGAGQVFRESTNPPVATADGYAAAFRAGAEMRDMEFIQFHPTVLYIAGSARFLMTEAIRGEGAFLVDTNGHRFMPDYDPRAELAPRDIVSQSIVRQMTATQSSNVYLDLSHLQSSLVLQRFPGIAKVCRKFGLDITTDRIPVRPGAHYMIGGVTVDTCGRTRLPGLWAAGEVTSSGLHGANRLASNSLLEGLVYGAHAGERASQAAADMPDRMVAHPLRSVSREEGPNEPIDIADVRAAVKSLMGRLCGVERTREGLLEAVESLDSFGVYVLQKQFDEVGGWELQNLLTTARLMAAAALAREESRGVHFRSDFPEPDDEHWRRHLIICREVEEGVPCKGPLLSAALTTPVHSRRPS